MLAERGRLAETGHLAHIQLTSMRANLLALVLGLVVSAALVIDCRAMEVTGPARVVDGDTLEIGVQAIRIHGIDAPETSQKCQLPKDTWDCSNAVIAALAAMTGWRKSKL